MNPATSTEMVPRALMIIHDFPCAGQPFVLNQILGLIDRGCDLRLVAKRSDHPPGDPRTPQEVGKYRLPERTIYLRAETGPKCLSLLRMVLRLVGYATCHPVRFGRAVASSRRTGDFSALQVLSRAGAIGRLGRIDVIHCQFGTAANMGLLLRAAGVTPEAKVIVSFRGSDISSSLRRTPRLYRDLVAEGDYFLPVCSHFGRLLQRMGVPEEKVEVHYSGINLRKFPLALERQPNGLRVLAVGRLVEKKGYDVLLEAISRLRATGRNATLTVIGGGPLRERVLHRIRELRLGDAVRLVDWVPHDAIVHEMHAHDALVAASMAASSGDLEGIPNVVKEAMASGLPVVSTRHSGIPDLVTDGETGFLVPEGDAAALAAVLQKVMDSGPAIRAVQVRARQRVEALMSAERLNDRLLAIYQMIAARNPGARM